MNSPNKDINYRGPSLSWRGSPSNVGSVRSGSYSERYKNTSSNVDILLRNLDFLLNLTNDTVKVAEEKLQDFNLLIDIDTELENAQKSEWPSELGTHKNHISYSQYRVMRKRESSGSSYIAKAYEHALRGTWGTVAMDIARINANVASEALRIKDFISSDIFGDFYDQAESRAIELLQEWSQAAVEDAGQLRAFFEEEGKAQEKYSRAELDRFGPAKARNYQAILQVRLNATADEISKIQKDFDMHFGPHSVMLYDQYLIPALQFRREVSSEVDVPVGSFRLDEEMYLLSKTVDNNVLSLLKDVMRRNGVYRKKITSLKTLLAELNLTRKTISDLSSLGALPDNVFVKVDDALTDNEHFDVEYQGWLSDAAASEDDTDFANSAYNVGVENRFKASHSLLADLTSADAHPQYLLKDGGTITGNISVEDGVTIDGVDLSSHKHDGTDGSVLISGSAISPGTLSSGAVDTNDVPDVVDNLTLVKYNTTNTINGDTVYEAVISWEGPEDVQFEVQLHRIGT